ncbi:PspC domain-containing protein [Sphingobacterium sp.]|jgi:phage shock protein PspC (stress-responsive transcriptional regulator)|uniref:PspC domain-containing protein n=1 Tax=Sphingobacterium sp. TaxID=341027 RepID=UPI00289EF080|nr:PspC domain-containing protein [Sphingobacterium sp.]
MNKTIIININSIVFHIEEDAYEVLRSYMIDIKKHFGQSEDSKEILEDIENRISEMFTEKIQAGSKEVLNMEDVNAVIDQMGRVSDFETEDQDDYASFQRQTNSDGFKVGKKLMRDPDDKVFSGVCSGLGHFFGIEAKWVRLLFALFVVIGGSGVLVYVILWIVMPLAITRADKMEMRGEAPNIHNFKRSFDEEMSGVKETFSRGMDRTGDSVAKLLQIIVKIIGVFFVIIVGLSLIGLIIGLIFFALAIVNVIPDVMDDSGPFYLMNPNDVPFALIAGFLSIFIPFAGLFYLLLRVLFEKKPMNNYLTTTLFLVWLASIGAIVFYSTSVAKEFRESSTIVEEKPLQKQPVYYLNENDVRVIRLKNGVKSGLGIKSENLSSYLKRNIHIRIERIDSLQDPYVRYEYSAKGSSYKIATDRAGKINYALKQDTSSLTFDNAFQLNEGERYRDQEVNITLFLPVGTKLVINDNLEDKLRDISFYECRDRYKEDLGDVKDVEFVVTSLGLKCALSPKVLEEEGHDSDSNSVVVNDTSIVIRRDTIINVKKDGVSIQTKTK